MRQEVKEAIRREEKKIKKKGREKPKRPLLKSEISKPLVKREVERVEREGKLPETAVRIRPPRVYSHHLRPKSSIVQLPRPPIFKPRDLTRLESAILIILQQYGSLGSEELRTILITILRRMGVEAYDADIDNSLTRLKTSLRLVEEANDMFNLTNKGKLVALHVLKKEQNLLNILERVEEEILRSHIPKVCLGNECELKTRYIINYELIHPLKASELVFPRAISLKTASLTVSQQIKCSLIERKEPQETLTVPKFKVSEGIKLALHSKALAKEVLSAKVEGFSHSETQVAEEYALSEAMGERCGENVFELIFREKSGKGIGGAMKYSGEPIYIVLARPRNKDYECCETLRYICSRALREFFGILPEERLLSSGYGRKEIEEYLKEREITVIDEKALFEKEVILTLSSKLEIELKEIDEAALMDRIKEIGGGERYVIFHVNEDIAGLLYDKLWAMRSKFHDKIFLIEPIELPLNVRRKLAELVWAFVSIPESGSYDELFGSGKVAYYRTLEEIDREVSRKIEKPYPIVRTHRLSPESREHLLIKKFLAKYLVDCPPDYLKLSKISKNERYKYIRFEKEIDGGITSDAYIECDEIAIEVETLFEEGKYGGEPIAKIRDETVEKYRQNKIPLRELWIVMENITMLRHLGEIQALYDLYKRQYNEGELTFKVKFFALNLKDRKLIGIEELVAHLRRILKER